MKSTSPRPPTHCVSARHMRSHAGRLSGDSITELPVVVKPLTDSNRASVNEGTTPAAR